MRRGVSDRTHESGRPSGRSRSERGRCGTRRCQRWVYEWFYWGQHKLDYTRVWDRHLCAHHDMDVSTLTQTQTPGSPSAVGCESAVTPGRPSVFDAIIDKSAATTTSHKVASAPVRAASGSRPVMVRRTVEHVRLSPTFLVSDPPSRSSPPFLLFASIRMPALLSGSTRFVEDSSARTADDHEAAWTLLVFEPATPAPRLVVAARRVRRRRVAHRPRPPAWRPRPPPRPPPPRESGARRWSVHPPPRARGM